jgi:hypothetical protein
VRRLCAILIFALAAPACSYFRDKKAPPPPIEYTLHSPFPDVKTFAIAPALNYSGSRDFDPLVVSDTLFTEMQQVEGLNVLPLNKTLMAMQRLGIRNITDVATAQKVAEMLGADGLIAVAVTAYDPYNPPTVGMILQVYTPHSTTITADAVRPNTSTSNLDPADHQPVAQVNAVFNASNQSVLQELRGFASGRSEYDSALREEKFLVDSDHYMRFVCHAMVRRLIEVERSGATDR